ncbi:MAG: Rid family hydrolase [Actinomycetota bacterium]
MDVERHFTHTPWEPRVGYCRAIRVGTGIHVSGTVGVDPDGRAPAGAYAQAALAIARVVGAVEALGGTRRDIVRTRMFATHPARDLDEIARAHREAFADHPPATSLLGVSQLVEPGLLVEIEAEAEVGAGG